MSSKKNILCKIGIAIGIIAIAVGIFFHPGEIETDAYDPGYSSFGADYYTYQYKVTRYAGAQVEKSLYITRDGFSYLLIFMGSIDIIYFLLKNEEEKSKDKIIELLERSQTKEL